MRGKLKLNLIGMEIIFLLIVVGGSSLVYSIFAAPYYKHAKDRLVMEAFEDIKEVDLSNPDREDMEMFACYEEEHFSFTITDEKLQPVYTTRKTEVENTIRRNVELNLNRFSDTPQVLRRSSRSTEGTRLLGTFTQAGVKYYICIKETYGSNYSAFFYTEKFLAVVVVLAVILGSIVMYVLAMRIARPIEKMAVVSKRLSEQDFSARVTEETPYEEVNTLARNFNDMADQLQYYIQRLENSNSRLEQDKEALQEQNEQKIKLEKMRQEFFANISHELKTPLAVISSQVEMLELLKGEGDSQYYFASIHEEIDKMAEMTRSLMKISAAEHDLEDLDMGVVDLAETLEYLMFKYEALFQKKELKVSVQAEEVCVALVDRACIEKAMSNYLLNAVSHTGSGRKIEISLVKMEEQVIFRVFNEGMSIKEQDKEKIWNDYYQVEQKENHAGLGLYIVKKILLLHQGRYGVKNIKNGVEFWFELPLYREAAAE